MRLFQDIKNMLTPNNTKGAYKLITDEGNGYYNWDGKLYKSDIIRSCIRPYYKAAGKLEAKHILKTGKGLKVFPDIYLKFLLKEPNPYMTGQMLQEKMAAQVKLNGNAYAAIFRDENGYATDIYPVPAVGVEALYDDTRNLYLKFSLNTGKTAVFAYTDVIHLRNDFFDNDIFGTSPREALKSVMQVITITDQGIIKAIINSNVIKWLLRFANQYHDDDIKKVVKDFNTNYLNIKEAVGAAMAVDSKVAEVKQVEPKDYVPNATQMDKSITRIYNFFGVNEKIIQNKCDENEWNAYYEGEMEPLVIQFSSEFSRKIFSRREREAGNSIVFVAGSLQYASMSTKLQLVQFVDRAIMSRNEVREMFNLEPVAGGDEMLLRLDTATVKADKANDKGDKND